MKTGKNLYKLVILAAFTAALTVILALAPRGKEPKPLVIYDVHTDNPRIVKDDNTIEFADYVRIRNNTDTPYDLTGLFLSDSRKNLKKLPLDGVVIDAHDSIMIRLDPSWNFALQRGGSESVYLSDRKGNVMYEYKSSMKPPVPELSAQSGFYSDDFYLKMSVKKGYTIHYTLNGDEPGDDSPVYTEPLRVYDRTSEPNTVVNVSNTIKNYLDDVVDDVPVEQPNDEPVDKAFIVRAVAMDENGNKSDIVTREYFFCGDKYKNIISVVADRNDLFGPCGIVSVGQEYDDWYLNGREGEEPQTNYSKKGKNWEVPADVEYFRSGNMVLSQKCGLRLQGRTTRDRRIKNFQLRAKNRYSGSDVFEYDIFENEVFRTDAVSLDDCFRESFFLSLIEDEKILKQKTTDRVALFVNGEYWNAIYIRERLDEKYFQDHFGVLPGNLLVLAESFPEIGRGRDEETWNADRAMYLDIGDFVSNNDISDEQNYEKLQTMMDIDSYIDYLAINEWAGCSDWGEFNNDMYWRFIEPNGSEYGDGRFRWIIHDGDATFDPDTSITNNPMVYESVLYQALMSNENFRSRFADRLKELGETTFSDESVADKLSDPKWDEPELKDIRKFFEGRKYKVAELIDSLE